MRCPWCDSLTSREDAQGFCTECSRIFHPSLSEIENNREVIRLYLATEHLRLLVREVNFDSLSQQEEEEEKDRKIRKEKIAHERQHLIH